MKRNYTVGELQDFKGDTLYPHTDASVVFCTDGESVQDKVINYETALGDVLGVTDSLEVSSEKILPSSVVTNRLNERLDKVGNTLPAYNSDTPIEVDADTQYFGISITLQPGVYIISHLANVSKAEVNNYYMGVKIESGKASVHGTQATATGVKGYAVNNLIIAKVTETAVLRTFYKATLSFKINTDAIVAVKIA